jgi:HSP20 family molecular chaperone IbpA
MRELMQRPEGRCTQTIKSDASAAPNQDTPPQEPAFSRPRYYCQEQAETLKLIVHVPGVDPDGIDLEVNAPDFTITASRNRSAHLDAQTSPLEKTANTYQLRLRLGFSLAYEAIQAELRGSTLTVTIPKKAAMGAFA